MKKISLLFCIAICFVMVTIPAFAQWHQTLGLSNKDVQAIAASGAYLFAGTGSGGVYCSVNNGFSWSPVNNGLTDLNILSLAASDTELIASTYSGLFSSTNYGATWFAVNAPTSPISTNNIVISLAFFEKNIFALSLHGTFRSPDHGINWILTNEQAWNSSIVRCLAASASAIFLSLWGQIEFTTDKGDTWHKLYLGSTDTDILALAASDTNLFVGTPSGIFCSTTTTAQWMKTSTGLTINGVSSLAISGMNLVAGVYGSGVWMRPLTEIVTSVDRRLTDDPPRFRLDQNYPNPFNPSTTIGFSLPFSSFVALKIFDVMGREVTTLAFEEFSAGNHSCQWDTKRLPGGVYFYTLEAGTYRLTKSLVLLR